MSVKKKQTYVNQSYLRDDVKIGDQCGLKDDGDVRSVEKFNGVAAVLSTVASRFDGQVYAESLEVYNHGKDQNGGHQVHQVGQVLAVESFAKSAHLVLASGQQVE